MTVQQQDPQNVPPPPHPPQHHHANPKDHDFHPGGKGGNNDDINIFLDIDKNNNAKNNDDKNNDDKNCAVCSGVFKICVIAIVIIVHYFIC